jgi:parallel beta-helix repeat protein
VNGNIVTLSGDDGIDVRDSFDADIRGNVVTLAGGDGIFADNIIFGDVRDNLVSFTGDDGIDVRDSFGIDIVDNATFFTAGDGIQVRDSWFANIDDNFVRFAGDDGIDVERTAFSTINGNNVRFTLGNGIELEDSAFVTIDGNTARNALGAGIFVDPSYFVSVSNNTLTNNIIGLHFDDVHFSTIENNEIANNLLAGVVVENSDEIDILFNNIHDNGVFGLWAGYGNGLITLVGNTFTDNPVGALFHSGAIDISDLANPNSFINTDPLATPVGMVFDGSPTDLTIVGETLGGTIFEGFGNLGSYYVYFTDGSILDPGTLEPIIIDGLNASFDGIVPADFGGVLPVALLNFIEDRLHDADDPAVNGRGQIFVGIPESLTIENFEDFFKNFDGFGGGPGGLRVTVLGLPSVGPINAAALANIAPAAGGEEGQTAEELAGIEPAAGGEETTCWGDAVNLASTGAVANFDYGGTFEDSIAQAANCGSQSF